MKFKDYLTLTLSILAFILSLSGFYFQNLREYHSLRTSVLFDLNDWSREKTIYSYKGFIINYGNKTEVVSKITPQFGEDFEMYSKSIGPYVLKSGEAITFEIKDSINFFMQEGKFTDSTKEKLRLKTRIEFDVVNYNGGIRTVDFELGTLFYHEPSDTWTFNKDLSSVGNWFDLTK